MWIDTRECVPLYDGYFFVQTVYGNETVMMYTYGGGWNTYKDKDGNICDKDKIDPLYIVRWYRAKKPPKVPKKWLNEYRERRDECTR